MNKQVSALFLTTAVFTMVSSAVMGQNATQPRSGAAQPSADTVPPPQAPFVRKPAPYARWIIKFDRPKTPPVPNANAVGLGEGEGTVMSGDKPVKIDSIDYAKTEDIGCATMALVDGMRLVRWSVDDMVLSTYPGKKDVYLDKVSGLVPQEGRFMTDYPYFGWLDAKNYVGAVDVAGVKCYLFHQDGGKPEASKPDATDGTVVMGTPESMMGSHGSRDAWVTVDGRWPMAYRDDGGLRRFNHLQPPPTGQKLQLPQAFKAQLDIFLGRN